MIRLLQFIKELESVGVFHCDIKPSNIVLVKKDINEYDIKLIDFAGAVLDINDYPGILHFIIYIIKINK